MTWLVAAWAVGPELPGWQRRVRLTVENPTGTPAVGFPLLVRLDPTRFEYGVGAVGGVDLRFTDPGGVVLPHAIDTWTPGGESTVWVQVSGIDAVGAVVWMHYGNPLAPSVEDPSGVWDGSWLGVWHLGASNESTGRQTSAWRGDSSHDQDVSGRIGHAREFDGEGDWIEVTGDEDDFDIDAITVSAWVRRGAWSGLWTPVVAKGDSAWRLHRRMLSDEAAFSVDNLDGKVNIGGGQVPEATWVHLHGTYEPTGMHRMYVDGVLVGEVVAEGPIDDTSDVVAIGHNTEQPIRFWVGRIDEVQIQQVSRSPHWVALDHASQTDALVTGWCDSAPGLTGVDFDGDGDGVGCIEDCDPEDPFVGRLYHDFDGDGFGSVSAELCTAPDLVGLAGDCDDLEFDVNPAALDIPGNGIDENCDGHDAPGPTADTGGDTDTDADTDSDTDTDADTDADSDTDTDADADTDADSDADADADADSDADTDPDTCATQGRDFDCDGDGQTPNGGDCDDTDPTVYTGAPEQYDPVDHDCDGSPDPIQQIGACGCDSATRGSLLRGWLRK